MASQPRREREAQRRLSIQTLAVASASSATAAIVVSQFWQGGTAPAAAVTPVVVSIVSELLHRPAEAIKGRVTGERAALLPEGAGAGAPAQRTEATVGAPAGDLEGRRPASDRRPPPLRDEAKGDAVPSDERAAGTVSYHHAGRGSDLRERLRHMPWRVVAATAALAFVIGAAVLTLPELIAGESVGKGERSTTLFGSPRDPADQETEPAEEQQPQDGSQQDGSGQDQRQPSSDREQRPQSEQKPKEQKAPAQTEPEQTTPEAPQQKTPTQP